MKIKIPIPGERNEIREAIQKVRNEEGTLSKAKIEEIHKQVHKRAVNKARFIAILAALGISDIMLGPKLKQLNASKEHNNVKLEQEHSKQKNVYKESLKTPIPETEQSKEVNNLKTKDEVLSCIKNKYVKQREIITGNTDLKAEDIKLYDKTYQDYVYINKETGQIITHGKTPYETEKKLENDGVSYDIGYNYAIYKVEKEGKVIDCMTTMGESVILGDQYGESYTPILPTMERVIPTGIRYALNLESGSEYDKTVTKRDFIEALEEFENAKENQSEIQEKPLGYVYENKLDENPEEGLEHE